MLKLLVSYYSPASIRDFRPCCSPLRQDDDDLALTHTGKASGPRAAASISRTFSRTATSVSSLSANMHGLGIRSGRGKSRVSPKNTSNLACGPPPSQPMRSKNNRTPSYSPPRPPPPPLLPHLRMDHPAEANYSNTHIRHPFRWP